jgi:hypothetical protein
VHLDTNCTYSDTQLTLPVPNYLQIVAGGISFWMYAQYVERKTMNITLWEWLPRDTWFPSIVVHHLKQELELLDGFIASGTKRLHEVTGYSLLYYPMPVL